MPNASQTLVIEPVSAFNGLDVLVARDEGLFAAEGLEVQIAPRQPAAAASTARGSIAAPTTNQGRLLDQHAAAMFQG